jgi:hypothetical protein
MSELTFRPARLEARATLIAAGGPGRGGAMTARVEQMVHLVRYEEGRFRCRKCRKPTHLMLTRPDWWATDGRWYAVHADSWEVTCGKPVRAEPE